MAKIWRNRIIAGTQMFSNCPIEYRDEVKILLKEDVANAVISSDQYKEFVGEPYKK